MAGRASVRLGLRWKIALFFAALLLAVNLLVLGMQREPIVGALERGFRTRGRELALNLAARAGHDLSDAQPVRLPDLLERFLEFDGVEGAAVLTTGTAFCAGTYETQRPRLLDDLPDPGSVVEHESDESWEFVATLPGTAGSANVRLDSRLLAGTVSSIGGTIVAIAFATVGAGFLLVFAAASAFTRPLRHLADLARRIRGGELGAQLELSRTDEIGELASAMNAMSVELGAQARDLKAAQQTLEARNEALVEQQHRLVAETRNLETLVASIAEGVIFIGLDGKVRVANRAAARILGIPEDRLRGRALAELDIPAPDAPLTTLLHDARARAASDERYHTEIGLADHLHTVTTVHNEKGGALGVLAVVQDLSKLRALESDQKELQHRLNQQDKMSIVGLLAASLAHELNTPLGTILLQTQRVAREVSGSDEARALEAAGREVYRCQEIVRRLLDFSRLAESHPVRLDLAEPVALSISLAEAGLRQRNVSIRSFVAPDVPAVRADPNQIEQILMNLISNAADALPEGGVIEVRLRRSDGGAEILVRDGGAGIPPEHRERVFEPFFTTKPPGKGTGLGLAICRRILEEHDGSIEIGTAPGGGTDVRVRLPAAEEAGA